MRRVVRAHTQFCCNDDETTIQITAAAPYDTAPYGTHTNRERFLGSTWKLCKKLGGFEIESSYSDSRSYSCRVMALSMTKLTQKRASISGGGGISTNGIGS